MIDRKQTKPLHLPLQARTRYDETVRKGAIITQSPTDGKSLREGRPILVEVSRGPTPRVVPQLDGQSVDDARQLLAAQRLVLGAVSTRHDEQVPIDIVLSYAPSATVPRDTRIDVVVSSGPAPRLVPRINGMSPGQAKRALAAVQLEAVVVKQPDDRVPEGQVISANYTPGTPVAKSSKVRVIVSSGPALIAIPDVRGKSAGDAEAVLRSAGFRVTATEGSPTGSVSLTKPTGGTLARRGTAVTLVTQ